MATPKQSPRYGCLIGRDLQGRLGQFIEADFGHADLTTAGASQALDIGDIPAGAQIRGVDIRVATAFSGGTLSAMTIDVGDAGDADAIVDGANVFAATDGQAASLPDGIAPNKRFDAATTLTATFTATGDDVADADAGACTVRVLFDVL
jgi:hypothetical protein